MSDLPLVMCVEDNEFDVLLLQKVLENYEFDVCLKVFTDGEGLLESLSNDTCTKVPPQTLVLLDLNLPKTTGFEVLDFIQSHPTWSALPVLVYTTSSLESERQTALSYDCVFGYLEKNSPEGLLIDKMRAIFDGTMSAASRQSDSKINCLYLESSPEGEIALQRPGLIKYGVHLETVYNCDAAIHQLGLRNFDCVIIDQFLAGQAGLEFAKQLRSMSEYRTLPIVLCGDWPDQRLVTPARQLSIYHFISKDDLYQATLPKILRFAISQQTQEAANDGIHMRPDISIMSGSERERFFRYSLLVVDDSVRQNKPHYITLGQVVTELRNALSEPLKAAGLQLSFDRSKSIGVDSAILFNLVNKIVEEFVLNAKTSDGTSQEDIGLSFNIVGMNRVQLSVMFPESISLPHTREWFWLFNAHANSLGGKVRARAALEALGEPPEAWIVVIEFAGMSP